jgi:fructokinase
MILSASDPPAPTKSPQVVCFGEVLWDSVPKGLFPGGAPMNIAYHLTRLGTPVAVVSAVGDDVLGDELDRRMRSWGVDLDLLSIHDHLHTGLVRVLLNQGIPKYEILEPAAWDDIPISSEPALSKDVRAVVFGSLAQRSSKNRLSLQKLLSLCPDATAVFDVNLRPPYDDRQRVLELASSCDVLKVNEDELAELLDRPVTLTRIEEAARELSQRTQCPTICVTAGSAGAGILRNGSWCWVDAQAINVRDTIGAGDSFLAAVIHGLLAKSDSLTEILRFATRLAAYVASNDGATPNYTVSATGEIESSE